MILPLPGSHGHKEFMGKAARDPNSQEALIVKGIMDDAAKQTQGQVRAMLAQMIDLVPGQLFRDIEAFHAKFGLVPTEDHGHRLPDDLICFRINFMLEELREYAEAVGHPIQLVGPEGQCRTSCSDKFDAEKAFDGLIDLVYVALGTAFLHRFPFNQGWDRVQAANMAKERASGSDDVRSVRKHSADIVKPSGWKAPVLTDLLGEVCTNCSGRGWYTEGYMETKQYPCEKCEGTGRRKREARIASAAEGD